MSQESLSIPRSNIYRLLSLGFRYPSPSVFKTFQSGEFSLDLKENRSLLPHFRGMKKALIVNNIPFSEFEIKFVKTFDTGSPLPPCPSYEGFYIEPRTAVMLEISEFYRHFGLAMSQREGKREFPDHISAELEFLHYLTFQETQDPENIGGYLLAERDFLERHLLNWVPGFCNRLRDSGMPFHVQLAEVTSGFIACEHEFVASRLREFSSQLRRS